jgi:hypothetical protein
LLWLIVAAGLAIGGLSLVPGWLVHTREILGEGTREVVTRLSPWQGQAVPVLATGVLVEVLVAVAAALQLARPSEFGRRALGTAALVGLGLLLGATLPVAQSGHASGVTMTPAWPLAAAILAGAVALASSLLAAPLSRRAAAPLLGLTLAVALGAAGARWMELNLAEGNGRHWSDGAYTRHAVGGQVTETLTLRAGTYSAGTRWSGTFEASGLVIVLTGDPVCPGDRGSYHVRSVGQTQDLTWDAIVDVCAHGDRARDFETGIWVRDR